MTLNPAWAKVAGRWSMAGSQVWKTGAPSVEHPVGVACASDVVTVAFLSISPPMRRILTRAREAKRNTRSFACGVRGRCDCRIVNASNLHSDELQLVRLMIPQFCVHLPWCLVNHASIEARWRILLRADIPRLFPKSLAQPQVAVHLYVYIWRTTSFSADTTTCSLFNNTTITFSFSLLFFHSSYLSSSPLLSIQLSRQVFPAKHTRPPEPVLTSTPTQQISPAVSTWLSPLTYPHPSHEIGQSTTQPLLVHILHHHHHHIHNKPEPLISHQPTNHIHPNPLKMGEFHVQHRVSVAQIHYFPTSPSHPHH